MSDAVTEGGSQPQGDGASPPAPVDGAEQRIRQLVAQNAQLAQAAEQQSRLNAELVGKITDLAARQAPKPEAPQAPQFQLPDDVDDATKRALTLQQQFFTQMLQQQNAQFQQTLQQSLGGIQQQVALTQVSREAAAMGVTDPAVVARAEEIARQYGSTPKAATMLALGEATQKALQAGATPEFFKPKTQQNGNGFLTGATGAPAPRTAHPLPKNFGELSPSAQYDALDKAGVGDIPL